MSGIIVFLVLNDNKLSSRMDHISEHINSLSHKIHFYEKMSKIIVNLNNNKYKNNNNSTCKTNHLQNSLLMNIIDTTENDVSNVDRKLDKRKIRTSSIKLSSTLFFLLNT